MLQVPLWLCTFEIGYCIRHSSKLGILSRKLRVNAVHQPSRVFTVQIEIICENGVMLRTCQASGGGGGDDDIKTRRKSMDFSHSSFQGALRSSSSILLLDFRSSRLVRPALFGSKSPPICSGLEAESMVRSGCGELAFLEPATRAMVGTLSQSLHVNIFIILWMEWSVY